ncbi:hypothetical protein TNCT6_79180 [Streptomyces sp. 6-11-2]|nr:hypothetical protein TNCT6_79180 [Streptomyces sp. 6-11-2]
MHRPHRPVARVRQPPVLSLLAHQPRQRQACHYAAPEEPSLCSASYRWRASFTARCQLRGQSTAVTARRAQRLERDRDGVRPSAKEWSGIAMSLDTAGGLIWQMLVQTRKRTPW